MAEHLTPAICSAYLDGSLDAAREHAFESHVTLCPECAAMLQAAARLEELIYQAAEHPLARPAVAACRRTATTRAAGSTMSAAAAVLLMMFSFAPPNPPQARDAAEPTDAAVAFARNGEEVALSCVPGDGPSSMGAVGPSGSMCSDLSEDDADNAEPLDATTSDTGVLCGADEYGRQSLCVTDKT